MAVLRCETCQEESEAGLGCRALIGLLTWLPKLQAGLNLMANHGFYPRDTWEGLHAELLNFALDHSAHDLLVMDDDGTCYGA